jgi:ribosomal protein L31E
MYGNLPYNIHMKKKTTIWFDDKDRQAIAAIREHYSLTSDSDAIRLALSLQSKEVQKKGAKRG